MVFKRKRPNLDEDHTLFLQNYVNKDLQRYFRPFNFAQAIMFCPKYRIKDNFIIPNGWIAHMLIFITTLMNIASNLYRAITGFNEKNSNPANFNIIIATCSFLSTFLYSIGYITNFVVNFRNRNNNVALVLKLQKILNIVNKKSKQFKRNILYNNCLNIFMIIQYFAFNVSMYYISDDDNKHNLLIDLLLMNFNLNILYAIRVIVLLQNYGMLLVETMQSDGLSLRRKELHCTRIFQAYRYLLDSYAIFIECFQDLIIFFVTDTFGHALNYLEITLTMFRIDFAKAATEMYTDLSSTSISFIVFIGWLGRNLLLILVLGIEMEKFYIILEKIQSQCAIFMQIENCTEVERRMFKNMSRLYRSHFCIASARGVFCIDATLPLQLTSLITTYVIVLLQFTFT